MSHTTIEPIFNPGLDLQLSERSLSFSYGLECFGPERLMCGSDWPYSLLNGDFDRVWGLTAEAVVDAAPDHAEQLLGGNASRIYRRARRVGRS